MKEWCGVERCLFGNGKELHFKKLMDFDTIGGKSNKNGARFDLDAMCQLAWTFSKMFIFKIRKQS